MINNDLYYTALAADDVYSAVCRAAGYASRWDVPSHIKRTTATLAAAYEAKRAADDAWLAEMRRAST